MNVSQSEDEFYFGFHSHTVCRPEDNMKCVRVHLLHRLIADTILKQCRKTHLFDSLYKLRDVITEVDHIRCAAYGDLELSFQIGVHTNIDDTARSPLCYWPKFLLEMREWIHIATGHFYNMVTLTRAEDSAECYLNDVQRSKISPVCIMSLGPTRICRFEHRTNKNIKPVNIKMEHGSMLVINSETINEWSRTVPKIDGIGSTSILTFMNIESPDPDIAVTRIRIQ
ncbi:DNA oxidative demethylase ALKBH2-like [Antedon mediterranea]|uniref:DNA oxidative demethylase ALKBH2-like n=1 Tax=Antedon mediterranea TaxID=105859 RepID=UPI003AF9E0EF